MTAPLPAAAVPETTRGPVRDMVIASAYAVCSAAAHPNTSVEQRWLRDRWLAALSAIGLTEEQARAECRQAMRGIYSDRINAPAARAAISAAADDRGGGRDGL